MRFTVFTPVYNRVAVLELTFQSLLDSRYQDFEWLVVDDGSTDASAAQVEAWVQEAPFPVVLVRQANQGKPGAHNTALGYARGELFLTLDAGDSLCPDALTQLAGHWQAIPEAARAGFAAVVGLCLEGEQLSGEAYPRDVIDSDYLRIAGLGIRVGERRDALRTDVLRAFPYPRLPGEKHIRPSIILRRIGHHYRTRFTNTLVQHIRHEPDGITRNRFVYRMRNPAGLRLYCLDELTLHNAFLTPTQRRRVMRRYVRYSLHAGVGLVGQLRAIPQRGVWLQMAPTGIMEWLADRVRWSRYKRRRQALANLPPP